MLEIVSMPVGSPPLAITMIEPFFPSHSMFTQGKPQPFKSRKIQGPSSGLYAAANGTCSGSRFISNPSPARTVPHSVLIV